MHTAGEEMLLKIRSLFQDTRINMVFSHPILHQTSAHAHIESIARHDFFALGLPVHVWFIINFMQQLKVINNFYTICFNNNPLYKQKEILHEAGIPLFAQRFPATLPELDLESRTP